ncbi:hypothetical protein V8G54_005831 [Vigna mungo]|uniref:Uncharacterized protein n=1 Tax=Vigna mungo TaxID=3915 RepID=A0AAQ3NYQ8_VIGMU
MSRSISSKTMMSSKSLKSTKVNNSNRILFFRFPTKFSLPLFQFQFFCLFVPLSKTRFDLSYRSQFVFPVPWPLTNRVFLLEKLLLSDFDFNCCFLSLLYLSAECVLFDC